MRISAFLNRVRILAFLIFKLAARRRNVATARISHGCFDARAFKRPNERIDAMFGGRLKRGARNIIEGQQIHVGGDALAEIDERLQVVVIVVEAFDKKVFERNSTATIGLVFLNCTMQGGKRLIFHARHKSIASFLDGGMQGNRKNKLLGFRTECSNAIENATRRNRDVGARQC